MPEDVSAFQLVLSGDPTLFAIVVAVNALAWTARRAGERLAG